MPFLHKQSVRADASRPMAALPETLQGNDVSTLNASYQLPRIDSELIVFA